MTIDFKEIPVSNKDAKTQDIFEKFSRDFLEILGYEIILDPTRGADGGLDIKVKETRKGVGGTTDIFWLVSCKHYAHTGTSVTAATESNSISVLDRVKSKGCKGFIGLYTTIANTTLQTLLTGLSNEIEYQLFDNEKIEKFIINDKKFETLFARFFPNSFTKWKNLHRHTEPITLNSSKKEKPLTAEDVFQLSKSAAILIEVIKIEDEFFEADWPERKNIIEKLYKYSEHSDHRVTYEVFEFLQAIAYQTRSKMPFDISISIHTLILSYFPNAYESKNSLYVRELGYTAVLIAWGIVYDALIHLNNLAIAEWALTIFKFIYQQGQVQGTTYLAEKINERYDDLERNLKRPERTDLGPALELVKIFRADMTTSGLTNPILPDHLYNIVVEDERK
jgi:hypothetical protein